MLIGPVSFENFSQMRDQAEALVDTGTSPLRIDLGQVTQVSSLTVGLMVACYRRAAKQGKAIQFENVSESLHKIIRVSGLQAVLLGGE